MPGWGQHRRFWSPGNPDALRAPWSWLEPVAARRRPAPGPCSTHHRHEHPSWSLLNARTRRRRRGRVGRTLGRPDRSSGSDAPEATIRVLGSRRLREAPNESPARSWRSGLRRRCAPRGAVGAGGRRGAPRCVRRVRGPGRADDRGAAGERPAAGGEPAREARAGRARVLARGHRGPPIRPGPRAGPDHPRLPARVLERHPALRPLPLRRGRLLQLVDRRSLGRRRQHPRRGGPDFLLLRPSRAHLGGRGAEALPGPRDVRRPGDRAERLPRSLQEGERRARDVALRRARRERAAPARQRRGEPPLREDEGGRRAQDTPLRGRQPRAPDADHAGPGPRRAAGGGSGHGRRRAPRPRAGRPQCADAAALRGGPPGRREAVGRPGGAGVRRGRPRAARPRRRVALRDRGAGQGHVPRGGGAGAARRGGRSGADPARDPEPPVERAQVHARGGPRARDVEGGRRPRAGRPRGRRQRRRDPEGQARRRVRGVPAVEGPGEAALRRDGPRALHRARARQAPRREHRGRGRSRRGRAVRRGAASEGPARDRGEARARRGASGGERRRGAALRRGGPAPAGRPHRAFGRAGRGARPRRGGQPRHERVHLRRAARRVPGRGGVRRQGGAPQGDRSSRRTSCSPTS